MQTKPVQTQDTLEKVNNAVLFVNLSLQEYGKEAQEAVSELCSGFNSVMKSLSLRYPERELSCSIGFSRNCWEKLFSAAPLPKNLLQFDGVKGVKYDAPATPGDIFFHIRATQQDICYQLNKELLGFLGDSVESEYEIPGFGFFDHRAIIGFVDGTENPVGDAALDASLVGEEDPDYAGGSYLFTQQYLHDMKAWDAQSVSEQEAVIGRTKLDDIEFDDEKLPDNAHIRVSKAYDEQGAELKILRANVPFSNTAAGIEGTFFLAYTKDAHIVVDMLRNMFIGTPPGTYDHLLDFSFAETGTLFFAPSKEVLGKIAGGEFYA